MDRQARRENKKRRHDERVIVRMERLDDVNKYNTDLLAKGGSLNLIKYPEFLVTSSDQSRAGSKVSSSKTASSKSSSAISSSISSQTRNQRNNGYYNVEYFPVDIVEETIDLPFKRQSNNPARELIKKTKLFNSIATVNTKTQSQNKIPIPEFIQTQPKTKSLFFTDTIKPTDRGYKAWKIGQTSNLVPEGKPVKSPPYTYPQEEQFVGRSASRFSENTELFPIGTSLHTPATKYSTIPEKEYFTPTEGKLFTLKSEPTHTRVPDNFNKSPLNVIDLTPESSNTLVNLNPEQMREQLNQNLEKRPRKVRSPGTNERAKVKGAATRKENKENKEKREKEEKEQKEKEQKEKEENEKNASVSLPPREDEGK